MSHTVSVNVKITNEEALNRAIDKLGLENLGNRVHKLYSGNTAEGVGIKLPDWNYPVVIELKSGVARYDNFGERWGKQDTLDGLVQRYIAETQLIQGEAEGMIHSEMVQEDGTLLMEFETIG